MFTEFTIYGRHPDDRVDVRLKKTVKLNTSCAEYTSLDTEGYRLVRMLSGTYYTIEDSAENREKLGI